MTNTFKIILGIVVMIIIGFSFYYLSSIITYVLIAAIMSLIGAPIMRMFSGIRIGKVAMPSAISAILTILCFYLFFAGFVALFLPMILDQVRTISSIDPQEAIAVITDRLNRIDQFIDPYLGDSEKQATDYLQDELIKIIQPSQITNLFGNIVGVLGNLLTALFSITFISFFFLIDEDLIYRIIFALVPPEYEEKFNNVYNTSRNLLSRYFIGVLIQMVCVGALIMFGLSIFGVKNAVLIGTFAGIINIIPYVGPFIGLIFGLIIALLTNPSISVALVLSIASTFIAVQALDNIFFQPLIFSNSVKAHPLEIFLLILIAGTLGGIALMIVAIPVYTVMRVVAKEFLSQFKFVKSLTSRL